MVFKLYHALRGRRLQVRILWGLLDLRRFGKKSVTYSCDFSGLYNSWGTTAMKIDLYTKAVLTVIAICLSWLVVRDAPIISTANAALRDRGDEVTKVQIVSIDEAPSLLWEALPVVINN